MRCPSKGPLVVFLIACLVSLQGCIGFSIDDSGREVSWNPQRAGEASYEKGMQLRTGDDRNIEEAIQLLEDAGAQGNDEALFALGEIYEMGDGVPRDFKRAFEYFERSASLGHPIAQRNVGFMYDTGKGVAENKTLSILYYTFAALSKDTMASAVLGYKFARGYGVPQSCETSLGYYSSIASKVVNRTMIGFGMTFNVDLVRLSEIYDSTRDRTSEHRDVVQYYQFAAEAGDKMAQVTLGHLFLQGGYGVSPNYALAQYYFQSAADRNEPGGHAGLGTLYLFGLGVDQNNDTAYKYLTEAASKDIAPAVTALGYMYLYGYGVAIDYKQAIKYFQKGANLNNHEALFYLGYMHQNGLGIPKDLNKAISFYVTASSAGDLLAQYHLAHIQYHIEGPSHCREALSLYKKVAETDRWDSLLEKAYLLFEQDDIDSALLLYEKGAEMGSELAQSNAAFIYDNGLAGDAFLVDSDKHTRALRFYKMAADQHSGSAHLKLGDYYYYGLANMSVDYQKAVAHYKIAADLREAQALFNMGYMQQYGIGLPQDYHLAKRNYDLALEVSSTAYVPVTLALWWLQLQILYTSNNTILPFLENVAIALLVIVLTTAVLYRQYLRQRERVFQ
eukprot:TRINITY_DN4277_c0_g1_i1.p1 TRINITY_DN4277_c0_g1~~TRINITY_DN4277_c0_g1_i1.p1  ORF type:complete len:618 (-),score=81.39 TRINITY_DN4277_c0_g1_i1:87-1940(-)